VTDLREPDTQLPAPRGAVRKLTMKILVIGGTGLIGSRLVKRLHDAGQEALAGSPSSGVNSVTGAGLADAMAGADVVVDVTNAPSWEDAAVMEFFEQSTRNLLDAAAEAGVRHYIALSVVGAERMPESGFMRAKLIQERLIDAGRVPYTIVRATQFFEFIPAIAESGAVDGTIRLPPVQFRPIAADDVAAILADVAVATPRNGMVEIAGPEALPMDQFARQLLNKKRDSRSVIGDANAGYFGAPLDDHTLTPGDQPRLGSTRFESWLSHI
jgi:uncharacterized protein YbjT (DUF2867 family)